mgnify:CR=1 FL=1
MKNFLKVWFQEDQRDDLENALVKKYNLASNKLIRLDEKVFKVNEIFTNTEGMVEQLNDSTYFIEEQNDGVLWVLQNNSVLYKNVFSTHSLEFSRDLTTDK